MLVVNLIDTTDLDGILALGVIRDIVWRRLCAGRPIYELIYQRLCM